MLLQLANLLGKAYIVLLTVAAGGFVGGSFAGFFPTAIQFARNAQHAPDLQTTRTWVHAGWFVGAMLFGGAALARKVHFLRKACRSGQPSRRPSRPNSWDALGPGGFKINVGSRRCGVIGSMGVGGVIGAFLGTMLGGSFLLLWFSLQYSPFAPNTWEATVRVEEVGPQTAAHRRRAVATDDPVAMWAFVGPIIVGTGAGAVGCGIGTALEQRRQASEDRPA